MSDQKSSEPSDLRTFRVRSGPALPGGVATASHVLATNATLLDARVVSSGATIERILGGKNLRCEVEGREVREVIGAEGYALRKDAYLTIIVKNEASVEREIEVEIVLRDGASAAALDVASADVVGKPRATGAIRRVFASDPTMLATTREARRGARVLPSEGAENEPEVEEPPPSLTGEVAIPVERWMLREIIEHVAGGALASPIVAAAITVRVDSLRARTIKDSPHPMVRVPWSIATMLGQVLYGVGRLTDEQKLCLRSALEEAEEQRVSASARQEEEESGSAMFARLAESASDIQEVALAP